MLQHRMCGETKVEQVKIKSITSAGKADVFNMEVEDTHNYVVNGGFVAHNCYDMLRYVCMDHPVLPTKKPPVVYKPFDPLNMSEVI